jgi:hypothetical protein
MYVASNVVRNAASDVVEMSYRVIGIAVFAMRSLHRRLNRVFNADQ